MVQGTTNDSIPFDTAWSAYVYIFMAIVKSSRVFKNWQNFRKSSKEMPCKANNNCRGYLTGCYIIIHKSTIHSLNFLLCIKARLFWIEKKNGLKDKQIKSIFYNTFFKNIFFNLNSVMPNITEFLLSLLWRHIHVQVYDKFCSTRNLFTGCATSDTCDTLLYVRPVQHRVS